nr:PREDICTED: modulator of retrovirus infection homolog [Apteryx mantelli mantelli]
MAGRGGDREDGARLFSEVRRERTRGPKRQGRRPPGQGPAGAGGAPLPDHPPRRRPQCPAAGWALPPVIRAAPRNEGVDSRVRLFSFGQKLQREEAEEKAWYGSEEEQELPPTLSTPAGSAGSAEEGSDCNPGLPSPLGAGAEKTGGEDSGDDVLKYVREIFFS